MTWHFAGFKHSFQVRDHSTRESMSACKVATSSSQRMVLCSLTSSAYLHRATVPNLKRNISRETCEQRGATYAAFRDSRQYRCPWRLLAVYNDPLATVRQVRMKPVVSFVHYPLQRLAGPFQSHQHHPGREIPQLCSNPASISLGESLGICGKCLGKPKFPPPEWGKVRISPDVPDHKRMGKCGISQDDPSLGIDWDFPSWVQPKDGESSGNPLKAQPWGWLGIVEQSPTWGRLGFFE